MSYNVSQMSQQYSGDQPIGFSSNLTIESSNGLDTGISQTDRGQSSFKSYDHLDPSSPSAKESYTAYDRLAPPAKSPYAALGDIEEVDLTSFAYQIASGMVGNTEAPYLILAFSCHLHVLIIMLVYISARPRPASLFVNTRGL